MAAKQMMQMYPGTMESDEENGIYVVEEEDENNTDTGTETPDNDFTLEVGYSWTAGLSSRSKRKQLAPAKAFMDGNVEDIYSAENEIESSSVSDKSLTDHTTKVAEEGGKKQSIQITDCIDGSGQSKEYTPRLSPVDKIDDDVSCDILSDKDVQEAKRTGDCDISGIKVPSEMTTEAERNAPGKDFEATENVSGDILRSKETNEKMECAEEDDDHILDEVTVEPDLTEDMDDDSRNYISSYPELVAERATGDEFVISSLNAKNVSSLKAKDKEIKKRKQLNPERFAHASVLREKEKEQEEKASPEIVSSELEKTTNFSNEVKNLEKLPELGRMSYTMQKPKPMNVKNKRSERQQTYDASPISDNQGKYFSFKIKN